MTEVLPPARRASRGVKVALAVGLLVVVAIAAAVSIKAMVSARASQQHTVSYSSQVVLPFAHLNKPWGAAVDGAGNLYIADHDAHQLLKLAAGASAPTPLSVDWPFGPPRAWRWTARGTSTSLTTATTRCGSWRRARTS